MCVQSVAREKKMRNKFRWHGNRDENPVDLVERTLIMWQCGNVIEVNYPWYSKMHMWLRIQPNGSSWTITVIEWIPLRSIVRWEHVLVFHNQPNSSRLLCCRPRIHGRFIFFDYVFVCRYGSARRSAIYLWFCRCHWRAQQPLFPTITLSDRQRQAQQWSDAGGLCPVSVCVLCYRARDHGQAISWQ